MRALVGLAGRPSVNAHPDELSLSHLRVLHDLLKESALRRGQHRAEGVHRGVVACPIDRGRVELLEWEAGPSDAAGWQQLEKSLSDRRKHLRNTTGGAKCRQRGQGRQKE